MIRNGNLLISKNQKGDQTIDNPFRKEESKSQVKPSSNKPKSPNHLHPRTHTGPLRNRLNNSSQQKSQQNSHKENSGTINKEFNFTLGSKFSPLNIKTLSPRLDRQSTHEELSSEKEVFENDKKIKETLHIYQHSVRKNEGSSVNTLFKVRTLLLNWLKDSEQDNLEYTKFITEKKMRYLLKSRDKTENRIKLLESELNSFIIRKKELVEILGEIYVTYETEELRVEIERFSNSYEIRSGKSTKMLEKFEQMKQIFPFVKEHNTIKENETQKINEKKELEKILKGSNQTLGFLNNYYKNLKSKVNDMVGVGGSPGC
jgi:hypothetical protein